VYRRAVGVLHPRKVLPEGNSPPHSRDRPQRRIRLKRGTNGRQLLAAAGPERRPRTARPLLMLVGRTFRLPSHPPQGECMSTVAIWNEPADSASLSLRKPEAPARRREDPTAVTLSEGAFPSDWPGPGAIDLSVQDLPHRSSTTEWWYLNTHFETADGRRLSLFAAFFRIVKGQDADSKAVEYAHSLTWALTDADRRAYFGDSRVDPSAPMMGLERIKAGRGAHDPRLNRAISEILERNKVPTPDRVFA